MTTGMKEEAAKALDPLLSPFHELSGEALRAVRQNRADQLPARLVLAFETHALVVTVDEHEDSVDLELAEAPGSSEGEDVSFQKPWADLVGQRFGWAWLTINQQGYCDGLLLSFGGLVPRVVLNVISSSIKTGTISGLGRT
jgi:hypothetical protein